MITLGFRPLAGLARSPAATAAAVTLVAALASPAVADEEYFRPVNDPLVAKECRACHMLYPVGLLPGSSWQRIVASLKDHFGENADVDEATAKHLTAYLTANGAREPARRGPNAVAADPPIRITQLDWFVRKHQRRDRISPATLARHNAKSAADCVACHKRGELGDFGD